jgi:PAS domain S-box-containing protein
VFIFWGPDLYCLYNDAFAHSIGPEKHPAMLGARGRDMWEEVWPVVGPQIDLVISGAGSTWRQDHLVPIIRHGKLDEVYWTYSQSPIYHEGVVGGVLVLCTETTERVQAEQHERAQLGRLRDVFTHAPTFVAMFAGPDYRVEFINEAGKQLVGGRDIVGKTVREALPEIGGHYELLDKVYRTGESHVARSRRVKLSDAQGEIREVFLDYICQPMRNPAGAVDGVFVVGYDVTEAIRANEALRRSERRFRGAIAAAQATLWTNDAEGRMKGEQPGWAALTGQSYEQYQDYGWANAVHPEDAQPTIDAWNETVAAQKPFAFEHRVKRADGEWRRFSIRAIPLLNDDGRVEEWVGVHTDVTDQRRARDSLAEARELLEAAVAERTAALQQSEARVRAIFETSHSFQGLLTPDGVVLDANAISLEAIKARREDVVGKPFWETPWFTGTPGTPEAVKRAVARVAAGAAGTRPVTINLPTGERSFDFSMRPVKNEAGKVVAIVPEAFETTARLKAEAALRQAQALEAVGRSGRPAHRRRRARFQQSADGAVRRPHADGAPRRPRAAADAHRAYARGRRARRQLDTTIAGVLAQAGIEASDGRFRAASRRHARIAGPQPRRQHQDRG